MGIIDTRIRDLEQRLGQEVDEGLLPSVSAAIGYRGEIVWTATQGDTTPTTRYPIFSCTKGLVAGVAWQLIGEGRLSPEDRVVEHFPEFGENATGDQAPKAEITVEQLLTHTSGFPTAPLGPPEWLDRAARVRRMASWRLNWAPGTRFEYHPTAAHWVLGEIIERIDGRTPGEAVTARIVEPLGIEGLALGVPEDRQDDIATLVAVGEFPSSEELQALFGVSTFDVGEVTQDALLLFNEPANRAVGVPGGGGVASASGLACYYQALLHNPGGLWDPAVLADATGRIRVTLPDPMLGHASNRSLGLIIAGDDGRSALRGMGHRVSPRTFGHNGAGGQIAWADPETGISFAYLTNGLDENFLRIARRTSSLSGKAALVTTDA